MSTVPFHLLDQAPLPEPEQPAGWREALAVRVLQAGAVAVVLAAAMNRYYELDRFYVPKELALHLTALLAGLLVLPLVRHLRFRAVDWLLLACLALGLVSAAFATNRWLAGRALAITASG
ncbi:MAG: hypothetical protein FIB01_16305, partial [Gemmatimonadetes bacterium]|nr:hypothetical protein [Gemmatimonadota bacterium]